MGEALDKRIKQTRVESPAQEAILNLLIAASHIRERLDRVCAEHEITHGQYNVLRILRGAEPVGLPTLTIAERMIERTPGITRMVDRLEAKGLVVRETRLHDRRCVYCRITQKGLDLLKLLDGPVAEANTAAFRGLSRAELEELIGLLEKTRKAHESE